MTLVPCPACDGHGLVERPEPDACPRCGSVARNIFYSACYRRKSEPDPWHREKR